MNGKPEPGIPRHARGTARVKSLPYNNNRRLIIQKLPLDRSNIITITGSRVIPKDVAGKMFDENLSQWIECDKKWLIGGARGVDHWAIEWLLDKKEECIIVVPFTIFEQPRIILPVLNELKSECKVIELNLPKSKGSYIKRNEYMINRSNIVVGFWTGQPGGSARTLTYGIKKGCEVHAYLVTL